MLMSKKEYKQEVRYSKVQYYGSVWYQVERHDGIYHPQQTRQKVDKWQVKHRIKRIVKSIYKVEVWVEIHVSNDVLY